MSATIYISLGICARGAFAAKVTFTSGADAQVITINSSSAGNDCSITAANESYDMSNAGTGTIKTLVTYKYTDDIGGNTSKDGFLGRT